MRRSIHIVIGMVLVFGAAGSFVFRHFEEVHRSVVLLKGTDTQMLGSVDLALVVTAVLVVPTVLAILFGTMLELDIPVFPILASAPQQIWKKLARFNLCCVLSLMLAQMAVAIWAWWPGIHEPHPAGFRDYTPARVIDLAVVVLFLPFNMITITIMLYFGVKMGKRLRRQPESPASPDTECP